MNETLLVVLFFAALLALEWRYRLKSLRVAAAILAAGLWWYAQPCPRCAARRALNAPPAERVTEIAGQPLSDYAVGVVTMEQAVVDNAAGYANERLLSMGVLFWLACSPVFRQARRLDSGQGTKV